MRVCSACRPGAWKVHRGASSATCSGGWASTRQSLPTSCPGEGGPRGGRQHPQTGPRRALPRAGAPRTQSAHHPRTCPRAEVQPIHSRFSLPAASSSPPDRGCGRSRAASLTPQKGTVWDRPRKGCLRQNRVTRAALTRRDRCPYSRRSGHRHTRGQSCEDTAGDRPAHAVDPQPPGHSWGAGWEMLKPWPRAGARCRPLTEPKASTWGLCGTAPRAPSAGPLPGTPHPVFSPPPCARLTVIKFFSWRVDTPVSGEHSEDLVFQEDFRHRAAGGWV